MRMERSSVIVVMLALFALCAGCGGHGGRRTSGGSTSTQLLYVSQQNSNTIAAFRIDSNNGTLTPVVGSPFVAMGSGPGHAAADPASHFLFVVSRNSASVTSYRISTGGVLTPVTTATTGLAPRDIAVHPSKSAVYVVNDNGTISGFSFDSFGSLFPLPGSPYALFSGLGNAAGQGIAIDPSGQFVYAISSAGIALFQVNSDDSLTLRGVPATNAGTSPAAVATVPGTKFLYSIDFGGIGAVGRVFGFSSANLSSGGSSTLTPLPGTPLTDGTSPVWLSVVPSGKFLYVAGGPAAAGEIRGYLINADGSLTPASGGAFPSPPNPVQLAIDATGAFIYSANVTGGVGSTTGDNVTGFTIDPGTGILTRINGSPFAVSSPAGLAIAKP